MNRKIEKKIKKKGCFILSLLYNYLLLIRTENSFQKSRLTFGHYVLPFYHQML